MQHRLGLIEDDTIIGEALSGRLDFEGFACELLDTSGLAHAADTRADADDPERVAQRFARAEHVNADLLVWVVDARRRDFAALAAEFAALAPGPLKLLAWAQIDRAGAPPTPPREFAELAAWVAVAPPCGSGRAELREACADGLGLRGAASRQAGGSGRELGARHVAALRLARARLAEAADALRAQAPLDLVTAGIKDAADALDAIDGRTSPEDVLDQLFARFCIGK